MMLLRFYWIFFFLLVSHSGAEASAEFSLQNKTRRKLILLIRCELNQLLIEKNPLQKL
jgi:hypothetical protein